MSTILILGGDGMLGHKMFQTLRQRYTDTTCTIRGRVNDARHQKIDLFQTGNVLDNVDAMDLPRLQALVKDLKPSVLVNCIGVIKQRAEAHSTVPSITLNSLLPHRLAETTAEWGGRVIHFSTDCVFSGKRGAYTEDDLSDAEDLYGKSKFLGEVQTENALTLRTSIVGRELYNFKSLLEWFFNQNNKTVRGFTGHLYSGVTTNYMAELVGRLIEINPPLYGLYQVTSDPISKYDFLGLVRSAFRLNIEIIPDEETFCDRSMKGDRFVAATGYKCPPWSELVADLASDLTPYGSWR